MWFLYILVGFVFGVCAAARTQIKMEKRYIATGFAELNNEWYKITKLSDLRCEQNERSKK